MKKRELLRFVQENGGQSVELCYVGNDDSTFFQMGNRVSDEGRIDLLRLDPITMEEVGPMFGLKAKQIKWIKVVEQSDK